jgi:hypothetical protein
VRAPNQPSFAQPPSRPLDPTLQAPLRFDRRYPAEWWQVKEEEANGKNLIAKRRQLRRYLTPFFGNQRLATVSTFTVDRYKRRRLDSGASNGTINLELATLSHLITVQ